MIKLLKNILRKVDKPKESEPIISEIPIVEKPAYREKKSGKELNKYMAFMGRLRKRRVQRDMEKQTRLNQRRMAYAG